MQESSPELEEVMRENEAQGHSLRLLLESLLRQSSVQNRAQEEESSSRPQKKVIRLSSSRKNSRRKTEEDRRAEDDKENPTPPRRTYQMEDFLKLEEPTTPLHLLECSQLRDKPVVNERVEPQSESKRGDSVSSQKKRRSKLEYMGRPPRQTSRAASSERPSESKEQLFPE